MKSVAILITLKKVELKKKMEEHLKNKKSYLLRMTRQLMFHASIYSKYNTTQYVTTAVLQKEAGNPQQFNLAKKG